MSKRVSATRAPAAKKRRATATSTRAKPEPKIYRVKNPDFYEKAVAARSVKDASWALGTAGIEEMVDAQLLKKMKRRPGVVFRKLKGLKREWEAW